jgi:hypothetical protein
LDTPNLIFIKKWQKWLLDYNPAIITLNIKNKVKTTLIFIQNLRTELEKVVARTELRRVGDILKLSDRRMSLILGLNSNFINKIKNKIEKKGYYKIAYDVLLLWKSKIFNIPRLGFSKKSIFRLIDGYMELHRPVIPLSRDQKVQIYRYHPLVKEDYFRSIDSLEKAYWLGFFFADGSISPRHGKKTYISFALKKSDLVQVLRFCGSLGLNSNYVKPKISRRLYKGEFHYYESFEIGFGSSSMTRDLYTLGFKGSKSKATMWPDIHFSNPLFELAFLLGFYDGEGKEGRTDLKVGSKHIVQHIKHKFKIPFEIDNRENKFRLSLGAQLLNLIQAIYPKSLARKRKHFNTWTHNNSEEYFVELMNPRLLRILINQFSYEKLAKIMNLKDTTIIHNLKKEWNKESTYEFLEGT